MASSLRLLHEELFSQKSAAVVYSPLASPCLFSHPQCAASALHDGMTQWVVSEACALGSAGGGDGELPPRLLRISEQATSLAERLIGARHSRRRQVSRRYGPDACPRRASARADDLVGCKRPRAKGPKEATRLRDQAGAQRRRPRAVWQAAARARRRHSPRSDALRLRALRPKQRETEGTHWPRRAAPPAETSPCSSATRRLTPPLCHDPSAEATRPGQGAAPRCGSAALEDGRLSGR